MTGSTALDVVIGLVFIFLLYSLFATIIMEILNSFLGLRARNLRYTLRRMLMDEKHTKKWVDVNVRDSYWISTIKNFLNLIPKTGLKLYNTFIKISGRSGNLTDPGLFHQFYDQPMIKYLSGGGIANKPSYITPQNFSKAIFDTIKSNFNVEAIFKKLDVDFDMLNDAFEQLDESSEIKKIFDALDDDQKNFKEWFNGHSDYDKLRIAAGVLPNNLNLKEHLQAILDNVGSTSDNLELSLKQVSNGKDLLEKIKAGIAILPEGSHTRKHVESLLIDANNNLQDFKIALEQWFDDTMEQSTGWFKQRVQYFLFIIGFVLAVSLNANTLEIVKKLSTNPEARAELVDLAIEYSRENKKQLNALDNPKDTENEQPDDKTDSIKDHKNDQLDKTSDALRAKIHDSLMNATTLIRSDIYAAQNIITANWHVPDSIEINSSKDKVASEDYKKHEYSLVVWDTLRDAKGELEKTEAVEKVTIWVHKSVDLKLLEKSIPPASCASFKAGKINVKQNTYKWNYVFSRSGWNFTYLWGYVLTALAISLGSPFWFDLLTKLVKLRSAVKPEEDHSN